MNTVILDLVDFEAPFHLMHFNIPVLWSFTPTQEVVYCYFRHNLEVMSSNRYHFSLASGFLNCRCSVLYKAIGLYNNGSVYIKVPGYASETVQLQAIFPKNLILRLW